MSAPTVEVSRIEATKSTRLFTSDFGGPAPKFAWENAKQGSGKNLFVRDVAVFRSGTFADSMGFVTEWADFQMDAMVSAYNLLKDTNVIPYGVPVRKGHTAFLSSGMDTLIGYHENIRAEKAKSSVDGETYNYVFADFEIWDEDAARHIERGDWRYRSAEVGSYESNSGLFVDPMYFGFAYVDLPAVEGLDFFSRKYSKQSNGPVTYFFTKELKVTAPSGDNKPDEKNEVKPFTGVKLHGKDGLETDPATIQSHIIELANKAAGSNFSLKLFGKESSDASAIQAHIDGLETAQANSVKAFRTAFVAKLASDKKILNTEVEGLTEFANGLSADQFETWSKVYANAAAAPGLGTISTPNSDNTDAPGTPENDRKQNYETAKQVLAYMKSSGTTQADLEKTTQWGIVQAYENGAK